MDASIDSMEQDEQARTSAIASAKEHSQATKLPKPVVLTTGWINEGKSFQDGTCTNISFGYVITQGCCVLAEIS